MAKQRKKPAKKAVSKKKKTTANKPVRDAAVPAFDVEVSVEFRGGIGNLELASIDAAGNDLETKEVSTTDKVVFSSLSSGCRIIVTGEATASKTTITVNRETKPATPKEFGEGNILVTLKLI